VTRDTREVSHFSDGTSGEEWSASLIKFSLDCVNKNGWYYWNGLAKEEFGVNDGAGSSDHARG